MKKGVGSGIASGHISQRSGSASKCHGSPTIVYSSPIPRNYSVLINGTFVLKICQILCMNIQHSTVGRYRYVRESTKLQAEHSSARHMC